MKRTMLMGIVALTVSLLFVSGVMAQQNPAQTPLTTQQESKLEKFSGVVAKVDETNKDILVQFHKEKMTFALDDHSKIMEGKKELTFSDLKKGMWASLEYKKEGNKMIAESIHVSMPKATAKKENPSEGAASTEKAPETK
jgi:hypothetical protein